MVVFFSFCSFCFKLNSISSLLSLGYTISSTYLDMCDEFDFLRLFFTNNGFPLSLINTRIKKFLCKIFVPQSIVVSSVTKFNFTLPYFGAQSEKMKFELSILLRKFFSDDDFHIILVNNFKICSFFSFKDKLQLGMRSSRVYKFSCVRCASEYVGSTIRTLHTRVAEHTGRSFRTGSILTVPPHSNIRQHALSCGVIVSIDNLKVMGSTKFPTDLLILESLFVHNLKPKLNDAQNSFPLLIVNH